MADSPLLVKSKAFALEVIKACNAMKRTKHESVLANQFLRSGTSIGANIREAFYGHSKADFIAKLQIALKECAESEYWIELLLESGCYSIVVVGRRQKATSTLMWKESRAARAKREMAEKMRLKRAIRERMRWSF